MKQIYRRTTHKKLGGVASGLADYFEIDPIITRALFVFGFFIGGSTLLLYVILWFMMPKDFEVMGMNRYNGFNNFEINNPNNSNYNQANNTNLSFATVKDA